MESHTEISPIASRVIEKCGGVARAAALTGKSESWVHRWKYPKSNGGTGGHVPRRAQEALIKAKVCAPHDFYEVDEGAPCVNAAP